MRPGDLVYFDPPYAPISRTSDFTSYTKGGFGYREHEELAKQATYLVSSGVKVIVSNSLTEFTKDLYQGFYIYPVFVNRIIGSFVERRGRISEILATSFPLAREGGNRRRLRNGETVENGSKAGAHRMQAREWLLENGYQDVARVIDDLVRKWKQEGKQTRRNWWEVLAGDKQGNPRVVDGRSFPVLRAAQIRQGVPVSEAALCRNPEEFISILVHSKHASGDENRDFSDV